MLEEGRATLPPIGKTPPLPYTSAAESTDSASGVSGSLRKKPDDPMKDQSRTSIGPAAHRRVTVPTVALVPWGDVWEDYLDKIEISLEEFLNEVSGTWLFGYVDALERVGIRAVLVLWSREARRPHRRVHAPTGTVVWVLPATRAHWLARRLRDRLWFLKASGPWVRRLGLRRVVRRATSLAVGYTGTPPLGLARVLRKERCDAIVVQNYEYPRFDVCVLLGRLLRLPVFATHQGGKPPKTQLEGGVHRWTVPAAAGLLIGARQEAEAVSSRHRLPPGAVTLVSNPIDLHEWTPGDQAAARAALGLPADVPVASWHGRMNVRQKGLDILVEAWRLVCAERPGVDLRLLLCGGLRGDRGSTALRRLIDAADLRGVHWRDEYVTDRTIVRRQIAASDVFVFPSRHEGFAVAPMEAMACARPVVACDAPGVIDLLGGGEQEAGGVVVPLEDPMALAGALGRLLDDRALAARLGEAARRAMERHSPEAVGRLLAAALHRGAPERFPAPPGTPD
jgi:glycosyltransferase involved in cell wall biosynthesis